MDWRVLRLDWFNDLPNQRLLLKTVRDVSTVGTGTLFANLTLETVMNLPRYANGGLIF